VTILPEKIILRREKDHCAIFIRAYFYVGFAVGVKLFLVA